MKIVIQKVPEGVKLTLHHDVSKKPVEMILAISQVDMLMSVLRLAMNSETFRFEYQP